jgi:hypothetical protein
MADYYPLIARAIAGLDPDAPGESRRALYERARAALIAQLRGVQPPLSESEITRERLSLEEAVRKVEAEAAQRARDGGRGGASRGGDAFRRASARAVEAAGAAPSSAPQSPLRPRPSAPQSPRNDRPPLGQEERAEQQRKLNERGDGPQVSGPQDPMQDSESPLSRGGAPRRGPDSPAHGPGMRGFRDIAADADDLGRAAAQANRAARKTYANVPSPSPEFDRLEPSMESRGGDGDAAPYSYEEAMEEAERYAPAASGQRSRIPLEGEPESKKRVRGGSTFPFKTAIVIGIVLILVGVGIVLWGKQIVSAVSGLLKPTQVVETPKDSSAPLTKPKIPDRVGQPSATEQVAPVAQRVVLYDEDPADSKGKQYVGTVVWRTEPVKASGNQSADIAVRADVEIPDRKFKMTMSFRRNTDSSLPASHTAELTFILPQDFQGGGVSNVPGILMKSNEQARGTPLAGLAVKVTDGFFLVGLSNVDADRARNIQLLKERSWFDVPLVYTNQRRAIIAIEKGPPGERAFNDAFAAWGE